MNMLDNYYMSPFFSSYTGYIIGHYPGQYYYYTFPYGTHGYISMWGHFPFISFDDPVIPPVPPVAPVAPPAPPV